MSWETEMHVLTALIFPYVGLTVRLPDMNSGD